MTKVFLLISKPRRDITQLQVKCTVCGDTDDAPVTNREFLNPRDLQNALKAAGVPDRDCEAAFHVHHNGLPTFIPVDAEVARKLGVLKPNL